jgi:hypothetical protein
MELHFVACFAGNKPSALKRKEIKIGFKLMFQVLFSVG